MNAIEWARKNVYLWQSSPVSGKFDERKYQFVIKPLASLDDIYCKTCVCYGPTQSFKTVFLQMATGYRLDVKRKSLLAVSQTDDDSEEFSKIKLRPFLERIPSLRDTVKKGANSITLKNWMWPTHEMIVSGPGENAQQSKSVCYVHTDEAHVWNTAYPGALPALDDRMGLRWDRSALHVTTAADAGTDIDGLYYLGRQNEWHLRCPACNGLFQPLWSEASKETYNGHEVFRFNESQSDTETLDSIELHCPCCGSSFKDSPRVRADMDEGADYVAMNPTADRQFDSYRWNAFAPRWKPWRDLLSIYLRAKAAAKLGNLEPYQNWVKKQEVRTWEGEFPMLNESVRGRDYDKSEVEVVSEGKLRVCSFDVQEKGGLHFWAQCDEFEKPGASKRVCYTRLETWNQCREFQQHHGVKDCHTGADCGHRERETYGKCAEWHWFALKSTDEISFPHKLIERKSKKVTFIQLPYSEGSLENPLAGRDFKRRIRMVPGVAPRGFCWRILWSKPSIYPVLYRHKNGEGHYYGIARDIGEDYTSQLHSYAPMIVTDRRSGVVSKTIWRQIRTQDHAFVTSAQNIVIAVRAGFFSLGESEIDTTYNKG